MNPVIPFIVLFFVACVLAFVQEPLKNAYRRYRKSKEPPPPPPPPKLPGIQTTHIDSDLGPVAVIKWKFIPTHETDYNGTVHSAFTAMGKKRRPHAGEQYGPKQYAIMLAAMQNRDDPEAVEKGRDLVSSEYRHFEFTEADIRAKAAEFPIEIVSLLYTDRRMRPVADIPEVEEPDDALEIGHTIPLRYELPPGTPYWKAPRLEDSRPFSIPDVVRDKTVYILGTPGMGKSTLMSSMIRQDIQNGKGVAVIDPAGDLADAALSYVPKSRIKDCIYIDPIRSPVGINFFNAKDDNERDLIAQDLVTVFKRLTGDSDAYVRMNAVVERSVQLLAQHPGATFLDIYRLLTDIPWQQQLAKKTEDEGLRNFWLRDYPKFPHPVTEQPIISRLQRFDANKALKTITGTASSLDFYEAIRQRKIVIINLAQTSIGEGPTELLGTLFVSQIQLAAFRQGKLPLADRIPFYLYVDEFHNFATSAFHTIIIDARKFKLCLTLANQILRDLDDKMRGAAFAANTRIVFRPEDEDARKLGTSMGEYGAPALMNQDEFECVIRPGKPSDTVQVRIDEPPRHEFDLAEEIIEHTQRTYRPNIPPAEHQASPSDDPEPSGPPPEN